MRIGELAKRAGVSPQTIRYYEREGVLPKARRRYDSGYRDYDDGDAERLRFIKRAQSCGLKLADIRVLLEWEDLPKEACPDVQALLRTRIAELDAKIGEMQSSAKSLERLLAACESSGDSRCAALDELAKRT